MPDMNIDERIERLTERHEALTQSLELLAIDLRQLAETSKETGLQVRTLTEIVLGHQRRIARSEDSQLGT